MMLKKRVLFLLLSFLIVSSSPLANAGELAGVSFVDSKTVNKKELKLNGLGLRTATLFAIKVYVAALYLENPSTQPSEIINSTQTKEVELRFVRSVGAKKLRDAWREGFKANYSGYQALSAEIDRLCKSMVDVKEGDKLSFLISDQTVVVKFNDLQIEKISAQNFPEALISNWLGPNPPNEGLKKGLLGVKIT